MKHHTATKILQEVGRRAYPVHYAQLTYRVCICRDRLISRSRVRATAERWKVQAERILATFEPRPIIGIFLRAFLPEAIPLDDLHQSLAPATLIEHTWFSLLYCTQLLLIVFTVLSRNPIFYYSLHVIGKEGEGWERERDRQPESSTPFSIREIPPYRREKRTFQTTVQTAYRC